MTVLPLEDVPRWITDGYARRFDALFAPEFIRVARGTAQARERPDAARLDEVFGPFSHQLAGSLRPEHDDTGILRARDRIANELSYAIQRATAEEPTVVAVLGMNGLKAINDRHGHPAGDRAIAEFFRRIVAAMGTLGDAYRNGGDEVLVIFPSSTRLQVDDALHRLVESLQEQVQVKDDGTAVSIGVSCGVASASEASDDPARLVERADDAERLAKEASRVGSELRNAIAYASGGSVVTYPSSRS